MFLVIVGNYDSNNFDSMYLNVLFLIAVVFTYFFVFTLLISLAVFAYTQDCEITSNQAYQEKTCMIALYSHLLKEKAVRDPSKDYLLIVTPTENRSKKGGDGGKGGLFQGQGGDDSKGS